jgi:hypothetical protein
MWNCALLASMCLTTAAFAQGGGNGNGGSGGGGAHGAATSGMTYHSEPVTSPWGAEPGRSFRNAATADAGTHNMPVNNGATPAKSGQ